MPSAYTWPRRHLSVVVSALVLASVSLPASAGARAPIVYAYDSAAAPAGKPAKQTGTIDKATQRIEFRYPGSSASAGRVEMASVSSPAAAPPVAEQGYTQVPRFAPAATPFDAAATVSQITGAREPVVAAAALAPLMMPEVPAAPVVPSGSFSEQGAAIVYGDEFDGLPTANGERFDQAGLTAAHPSLPLPSFIEVTNPANGRQVVLRVNDRGPFEDDAVLQVSRQAARELGFDGAGKATLTFRAAGSAPVVAARPVYEPTPVLMAVSAPVRKAPDELLGGDELAGGAAWTPAPAPVRRADVKWPEPPADWDVAPEKPATLARTKVTSAPAGTHYVQLASFSDLGNAEALYRGLQGDLPVEIVPARVNGADFFRVRVGPLASRETAQQLRDRLNAEGKGDGRVVTAE